MNNFGSQNKNPWNKNHLSKDFHKNNHTKNAVKGSESKFQEAQKKLQAAVQKYAKDVESSEDEEFEDENIIDSILKDYVHDKNTDVLTKTKGSIVDRFSAGNTVCLICISTVKRADSIWSCWECYAFFHLTCIQRWSKDTIYQKKQALLDQIPVKSAIEILWSCPKCRTDYQPSDIPSKYICYCGKTENPKPEQFLAPHSCGETCRKDLKPFCGHKCVLLCHPGPCPPCPKTVQVACYCGRRAPRSQRCSNKEWSCNLACNKLLICGKHNCPKQCHAGDCPPCLKKSIQKCLCGYTQKLRDCATPLWQCEKVCNKPLACGNHNCSKKCHILGDCEECILTKPRTCPCGKASFVLPCTEETPCCGDTCGKLLECGVHICNQRCHKDKCGICLETVTKSCRCGHYTREVQCRKQFLCETKCKKIKDCRKHPCNRKCCDGNCPPCEKLCGRSLNCGNHKCTSVCHKGPCYPCNLTEKVSCPCGFTSVEVPCGKKGKTRLPRCNQLCNIPPDCHHGKREKHRCHPGNCPPCRQICNKNRPNCPHPCPAPCHSAVVVKVEGEKGSMPWEQTGPYYEKRELPCPDCIVPVPVTCFGNHETLNWPCHLAKPSSCHRPCDRRLLCGNHTCSFQCHTVENAPDELQSGSNCEQCEKGCDKPRPEGCNHACPMPCHPGPCPPCKQMIRIKCYCGLTQPYVSCKDWIVPEKKENLQSCGNQCPKNYNCGHRCKANCHPGPCPNADLCKKKVKLSCVCKRIKKEFSCETVRNGGAKVDCDETCRQKMEEEKRFRDFENELIKRHQELKNLKELEKYEKKFQGRKKFSKRTRISETEEQSACVKYQGLVVVLSTFVAVFAAVLIYWSLS
ncbi:NF-X1-type zinc finger protein NFXL1 [Agrilus planipennis]|uniref:NF-X1-type zinc finger protein NFXL1 n=1 Tax=Agrilus planipennis TaxID=224129 RepID=A0A1W4XQV6_AGRPL|nr:NF-X1-type zinc finger protein NFXL1 [Agrilus planipennis]